MQPITASFSEATSSSMGANQTSSRQLIADPPRPTAEAEDGEDRNTPDSTQLNNARDMATARESSQEESRSEPQNSTHSDLPSDVSELIDEGIQNMSDISPELTSNSESSNLHSNKGMKYNVDSHIDPSLILQGGQKRKRSPTEKYVASTTTGEEPKDSYSNWFLAQEKKKKDREARKLQDAKKKQDKKK